MTDADIDLIIDGNDHSWDWMTVTWPQMPVTGAPTIPQPQPLWPCLCEGIFPLAKANGQYDRPDIGIIVISVYYAIDDQ